MGEEKEQDIEKLVEEQAEQEGAEDTEAAAAAEVDQRKSKGLNSFAALTYNGTAL